MQVLTMGVILVIVDLKNDCLFLISLLTHDKLNLGFRAIYN